MLLLTNPGFPSPRHFARFACKASAGNDKVQKVNFEEREVALERDEVRENALGHSLEEYRQRIV